MRAFPIILALLSTPLGAAVGALVTYFSLILLRKQEDQGRRGLFAAALGIPLGAVAAFLATRAAARWVQSPASGDWARPVGGALTALIAAFLASAIAQIAGTRAAESRGIPHEHHARSKWAFTRITLPATILSAIVAYFAGAAMFS